MDAMGQVARRFPLVARARPPCRPLDERIGEIAHLARTAAEGTASDRLAAAVAAQNKAALIASDCGMPELARSLCWRQAELFLRAGPLTGRTARYALEPLVNLARLLIRAGAPEAGFDLLEGLYRAVRTKHSTTIDGREVPLAELTGSADEHRDVCQWLWGVMLADGVRALVTADQWDQAVTFAQRYRGIGRRLLDGRQAVIVARALARAPDPALAMLEDSTASETWEQTVAACLTMFCRRSPGHPPTAEETAKVREYLGLDPQPELTTFRTRVALTAIDLSGGIDTNDGAVIARRIVDEVLALKDGYAARDLLRHPALKEKLTTIQEAHLSEAVQAAGLSQGSMPDPLQSALCTAVEVSRSTTAELLRNSAPAP